MGMYTSQYTNTVHMHIHTHGHTPLQPTANLSYFVKKICKPPSSLLWFVDGSKPSTEVCGCGVGEGDS